ncbi:hypothetical protein K435DRAFT_863536 [Dendrothele bispora CBS 962.96]|uniref:RRM domain-containing protein n=1 Tax=Dendrothele bispora (strain CBS 962.96) TaxID=1314807 RepID=A0A4V4HEJ3_DENBC|nr:hypothetical protein K435DRAFT_863536 [Dendrothele bispora CBS 962.96]
MSLSSVLLPSKSKHKKASVIDDELDALFKSSTKFPTIRPKSTIEENVVSTTTASSPTSLKRKHYSLQAESTTTNVKSKRAKAKTGAAERAHKEDEVETQVGRGSKKQTKGKKRKAKEEEDDDDEDAEDAEDEENSDLENAYLLSRAKSAIDPNKTAKNRDSEGSSEESDEVEDENENRMEVDGEEDDGEEDVDAPPPQHESLSSKKGKERAKSKRKGKYVPPGETPDQRDARTIFVGNLSLEVAQKKASKGLFSHLKALQRHILSLISLSLNNSAKPKIESTRFRSVPFSTPTSRLPETDNEDNTSKKKKSSRQHDIDRSSSWKSKSKDNNNAEDEASKEEKVFLTPAQKKKIAFINQEFHSNADTCHAYIVFAHPIPTDVASSSTRNPNVPPSEPVMDPYTAARLAKEACDGSIFMERAIRVDVVAKSSKALGGGAGEGLKRSKEAEQIIKSDVDPKRCVFVGNLDFESQEEDLRVFFEGVITGILGPRDDEGNVNVEEDEAEGDGLEGQTDSDDEEEEEENSDEEEEDGSEADDESEESDEENQKKTKVPKAIKTPKPTEKKETDKAKRWVTRVRIIRDKDTQLGKGFAYVQFAASECVDNILALEASKLKFAKRKLRVERCKTLPGGRTRVKVSSTNKDKSKSNDKSKASSTKSSKTSRTKVPPSKTDPIPKGDPSLGQKLAHLSKEERKAAKAADADRMARRLAKKKARMTMGTGAGRKGDSIKAHGKERSRERKVRSSTSARGRGGKGHGVGSAAKNKGKTKSDKSLEKRNMKK